MIKITRGKRKYEEMHEENICILIEL